MAKRRPPFIQVLAPAAVLFGFASGCGGGGGGKRHDSGGDTADAPTETPETGDTGDTGAEEATANAEAAGDAEAS